MTLIILTIFIQTSCAFAFRFYQRLARLLWRRRRTVAFVFTLFITLIIAALYWPLDADTVLRGEASGEMRDRAGRLLYAFMNGRQQWRFERDLDEISPWLVKATIAAEDRRFYSHFGVDPLAALRALRQNVAGRRVVSGASTLSMQVVKQARGNSSSLFGKLRQTLLALQLERRANKDEILAAYLNGAPYGLNLIGCEAAARRYFGKPARELSLEEAALLAGLPKAPTSLMPLTHPHAATRRRNYVLRRMLAGGMITRDEFRRALAEPNRATWHAFPDLSPHLAMRLKPAIMRQGRLRTSLDRDIQARAEELLRRHLQRFTGEVGNAAMMVLDVPRAAVLAHIGSGEFFDERLAGQFDATRALRSPGSALKPFTYTLAMEEGRLYSCEVLLDSAADYGLFNPENMDLQYHGLVTAESALKRSLNVPAVTVLDRVGIDNLYDFLRNLNFRTLTRPADFYGLGLTLGSCEVRLEDLAAAYCMLANLGEWRALEFAPGMADRPLRQAISRGTGLQIYQMLEQALPNETWRETGENMTATPRVCWKTGTSWGHHDAWAAVFNRQYLVIVWMGNSDAKPSPRLVGAQAALPLAGRMLRALPASSAPAWPDPAGDLHGVKVCAVSGLPASRWCKQTREAWLPREQFLNRVCDMHYPQSGDQDYEHEHEHETDSIAADPQDVVERWPGSARQWDLARITNALPGLARPTRGRADALTILSPANRAEFILTGAPGGDRIRLSTSVDARTPIYWYLDDRFFGQGRLERPLTLDLAAGSHRLVCMTPQGLSDEARFEVVDPTAAFNAPDGQ